MLAGLLAGCSDDTTAADNNASDGMGASNGNTLRLQIAMTSPMSMTRANTENPTGGENGDGWRLGRYNENNVYDVYLYKYSATDGINADDATPVELLAQQNGINFIPGQSDVKADGSIEKDIDFNVGSYMYKTGSNDHFIAAINTEILGTKTTLGELRNALIAKAWTDNGSQKKDCDRFTMSNAEDSRYLGGNGTNVDPYVIGIDVERTAARVDFAYSKEAKDAGTFRIADDGTYVYKIKDKDDELFVSHVRIANAMQSPAYLIKRLAETESDTPEYVGKEKDPAEKYVVEPTTWSKTVKAVSDNTIPHDLLFGDSWYGNAIENYQTTWFRNADKVHGGTGDAFTDGTSLDEIDHDWNYYVLGYVNENTMMAEQTLQDYTTGIILKGTYKPAHVFKAVDADTHELTPDNDYAKGQDFWRVHDVDSNTDTYFSTQNSAEDFSALFPHSVVFKYNDAQCYYTLWLRHENMVSNPYTTMMEFGIVRNNIYRICVEFAGIGMPDIPDDMDTPETIRMFIYVRKWNLINHPAIEL